MGTENTDGSSVALLYKLRSLNSFSEIELVSSNVMSKIASAVFNKDKSALRKLGIKPLESSLRKYLLRNFPVFMELDNLNLMRVGIFIVSIANTDSTDNKENTANTDSSVHVLSPMITYPPCTSKIPTPDATEVEIVIRKWIEDNKLFLVIPSFAVNAKIFNVQHLRS